MPGPQISVHHHTRQDEPAPRLFHFPSKAAIKENIHWVSSHLVDDPEITATLEETDTIHLMTTINSAYYFADYLKACGNFTEEESKTIQKHCIAIHDEMYESVKDEGYDMLCFEKFPVF